jgi:hypothetical protein
MKVSPNPSVQPGENSSEVGQFIVQILQCIAENQGAAEPVYQFLAANQAKLNVELLQVFPTVTSALLGNCEIEQKQDVAAVIFSFGNLIQQFPLGQRAVNMELAISAYEQALQVMTREAMPVDWAAAIMNLAIARDGGPHKPISYLKRVLA